MNRLFTKSLPSTVQRACYSHASTSVRRTFTTSCQRVSTASEKYQPHPEKAIEQKAQDTAAKKKHTKTQAELDEELREKMAGIAGDGGEAGLELEDGQPVSMKRSVKNNMFRYI